jgi:hypothetical protein
VAAADPAPFLVNGLPKAGTHLLQRAIKLFPGTRQAPLALLPSFFGATYDPTASPAGCVPVGIGRQVFIPADRIAAAMDAVGPGGFATGHVPYSPAMDELLVARGWKSILILRDPRDVALSLARYQLEKGSPLFAGLSLEQAILRAIEGCRDDDPNAPRHLHDLRARFDLMTPWIGRPYNLTVKFEDLVGSRGGGSDDLQTATLDSVARHLGLPDDPTALAEVARHAYGSTTTFRQGASGKWRDAFSPEHLRRFHEVAGSLLAELGYPD